MINPWIGIGAVLGLLAAALFGVRWASRKFFWSPELSRKAVHVFMGLVCLTFPWLFQSSWPVFLLAGISAISLAALKSVPALKTSLGGVLGGVERQSWGELLYAPSVAFVFWLSRGDPLLFCVPVLVLALADAAAALIGKRYGFARYETDDGIKSFEGSLGFFVIAFFATHVPLLLWTSVGRVESLLIAMIIGFLLMLIEAMAWRGLDNLFVPLVTYIALARMLPLNARELYPRFLVLIASLLFLYLWRRFTRFTQTAVIGAALVLYVSWIVGDLFWLIGPVTVLLGYTLLCQRRSANARHHNVLTIFWIGGTGIFWLCLSEMIHTVNTIYAYGVAYAAHLAMIAVVHFAEEKRNLPLSVAIIVGAFVGFLLPAVPYVFFWRENPNVWKLSGSAFFLILVAATAFVFLQPTVRNCPSDNGRWIRQGSIAALLSVIAFVIISILEPWSASIE